MADASSLTSKQRSIYEFICRQIDTRGFPPTIRDIGNAFAIKSPNGVMCHLKALEKKGFIARDSQSARAIRPVSRTPAKVGLPFKGLVAAGQPLAAETQDDRINLHEMFDAPDTFMLQVRGNSMIESHIEDGDFVVIRKQETARNGERVVAQVDGDYTLKRFFRQKDFVELRPENESLKSIIVEPGRDIGIVGVLVGVVRKC